MLTSWPNIYVVWILCFSYIDVNKVYYVRTGISIRKAMPLYRIKVPNQQGQPSPKNMQQSGRSCEGRVLEQSSGS